MTTKLFACTELAQSIRNQCKTEAENFSSQNGRQPCLAVVLVGDDPASAVYVGMKSKACAEAGVLAKDIKLAADTGQSELEKIVAELNSDDSVDGILVQSPLPDQLNEQKIHRLIRADKDVDCFTPENVGALNTDARKSMQQGLVPCTPAGVMEVLFANDVEIAGKNAVVIGRSNIVGKPMAQMLLAHNATVTICHSRTKDLAKVCAQADILVAAVGKPELVTKEFIKKGAVVMDVGVNRVERDNKAVLLGDVKRDDALGTAALLTPVPKGIGPMTIAMLIRNTVRAARNRNS